MILYELLTGVVPFEGETAVAIAFKQVSAEPRPPSELNPALPRVARRGRPARAREGPRRSATPTPTSSSPRSQRERAGAAGAVRPPRDGRGSRRRQRRGPCAALPTGEPLLASAPLLPADELDGRPGGGEARAGADAAALLWALAASWSRSARRWRCCC